LNQLLKNRDREILIHYERFWHTSAAIVEFTARAMMTPKPIFVAEFPPNTKDEDWVYATIGTSRQALPNSALHKTLPRVELFLYSRQRSSQISEFLAGMASYPFVNRTFLSMGDTIPGTNSIMSESTISDVLLTYPYFEPVEFSVIHHKDKTHTFMVWVTPIYPSERQFVRDHSWDALEDLFREAETDTSDFGRKPVA